MNESLSSVNHRQIGYRIKEVREQNNFSQARLAEETELSISYISHIENAKRKASLESIITSGLSFFAATFGVSCYSQVEMIGSICTLLARGAIISMVVVLFILPAMFMIFDKLICVTSIGFLGDKKAAKAK